MADDSVQTGVDALVQLLRQKEKISLPDAARTLGISEATVKLWVDFLVEEKMLGIEYKFTKPYIYLNKPKASKTKVFGEQQVRLKDFQEEFTQRATKSRIPVKQIEDLWHNHLQNQLELEKTFFYREARKRGFSNPEPLWNSYHEELNTR